jgi:cobalt/nickel transport system permease protein
VTGVDTAPAGAAQDDGKFVAPTWLLEREPSLCPCGCIGKRSKGSYVERTLRSGAGLLRQVMFADDMSAAKGMLQRVDPRIKILSLVALLITGAFVHSIFVLLALYAMTLLLAVASKLPLGFFCKRVWLFVPIFSGIVVLPATLSFVHDGTVILALWHWDGTPEGFTSQGLMNAAVLVARVALSISLVVLLTVTTSWTRLLAALRAVLVPKIFILVIGMAYRYLFHLLTSVTDMYEARKSRSVGKQPHDKGARAFVSASVGALIGKSHLMAEEVHQAMTARGFSGDAKTLDRFSFRAVELGYLAAVLVVAVLTIGGDRLLVH